MPDVFTGSYSFTQPEVGGSVDTWGTKLNSNWGSIDAILAQFVGMICPFAATGTVAGWLKLNGAEVSRTTYARLWNFASTSGQVAATEGAKQLGEFGPGDGSTTFTLPDIRGYVVRAYDDGAGVDTGRVFGEVQGDQNLSHSHAASASTDTAGGHDHGGATGSNGSHSHTGTTNTTGNHTHSYVRDNASTFTQGAGSVLYTGGNSQTTGAAGNHSHTLNVSTEPSHTHTITAETGHTHTVSLTVDADGGAEVRVKNVALSYYIRY